MNIDELRTEIDKIDSELTALIEKRMKVSGDIGQYKIENGLKVYDAARERIVIENNISKLSDKSLAPHLEKIYNCIMKESRRKQKSLLKESLLVGFQGVDGSFSHEACLKYIEENDSVKITTREFPTFDNLCNALLNGDVDKAIMPLENSSTGPVIEVYDLLNKYDFYIEGEMFVKVRHNLMVKEDTKEENIKEVYSHPQAFMQSKDFLSGRNYNQISYFNTAISAKHVSESDRDDIAAIASVTAANLYSLKIVAHDINYNSNNITKFIVLSKRESRNTESNKISIIASVDDHPGALSELIELFKNAEVNMTKIESRPDIGSPFNYIFFIDFIGNVFEEKVQKLLRQIEETSKEYKYLGNYKTY